MLKCIVAPDVISGAGREPKLFLAGGITGCPDWQDTLVGLMEEANVPDLILINPRRKVWGEKDVATEQIEWEHRHLLIADAILFWFPKGAICPIALFELGSWLPRPKPLLVGTHPEYTRSLDVEVQCRLERVSLKVVHSLNELVEQVQGWYRQKMGLSS